jgi:hypothetical protein
MTDLPPAIVDERKLKWTSADQPGRRSLRLSSSLSWPFLFRLMVRLVEMGQQWGPLGSLKRMS